MAIPVFAYPHTPSQIVDEDGDMSLDTSLDSETDDTMSSASPSSSSSSMPVTPAVDPGLDLPLSVPSDALSSLPALDWDAQMADVADWLERHLPHAFDVPAVVPELIVDWQSVSDKRHNTACPSTLGLDLQCGESVLKCTHLGKDDHPVDDSMAFDDTTWPLLECPEPTLDDMRLTDEDWALIREGAIDDARV